MPANPKSDRVSACALLFALLALPLAAYAQFKEIGPPPFSQAVAHQKIRKLLDTVDTGHRQQTIATLSGLVPWFRDILDEELIAAWKRDSRANLPEVIEALGSARVASGVVAFSWREQREATFNLAYAPMLTSLMARYPASAESFLRDLSAGTLTLSRPEAEAVCRILIDMPEIGTWKESAMRILPQYSEAAKHLLEQDLHAADQDKIFRAEMWMTELRLRPPAPEPTQQSRRRTLPPPISSPNGGERETVNSIDAPRPGGTDVNASRRIHVDGPPIPVETEPKQARPTLPSVPVPQTPLLYAGPKSGTYESSGGPIPQNAEYVFRNVPLVKMRLDYDAKIWEARLVPGEGKTQRLLVKNKSAGPQKHCTIHWSAIE